MSQRNVRKLFGGTELPPVQDSSDEEYEPAYAKKFNKNLYDGLEVNSGSEDNTSEDTEEVPEQIKPQTSKSKKNRKKKRKRQTTKQKIDEIEGIVREINAVFGEPAIPEPVVVVEDPEKTHKRLFTVKQQDFEVDKEMTRLFGPDDDDEPKKRGRQPNLRKVARKGTIVATDTVYKKSGLSMVLKERKDDCSYFVFEHNKSYQQLHAAFLIAIKQNMWNDLQSVLQESQRRRHVEGLLEVADRLYMIEEYTQGNKLIEEIIGYMQFCSHCFFSVTDLRTRLEYIHVENRAFHIALMKYMHMLTNKACHRTALEIGKLLLNLDPSDPLAVLFIIDTIAIRAKQYQWLVEAIDFWNKDRDAGFLFNMQYSYALANFHLTRINKAKNEEKNEQIIFLASMRFLRRLRPRKGNKKNFPKDPSFFRHSEPVEDLSEGFEKADELLQKAMLKFPTVITHVMQNAGVRNPKIKDCPLFSLDANDGMSTNLKDLIKLYARLIWNKFSEEPVMKWVIRNATILVDKYMIDTPTRDEARSYANMRMNLFQTFPPEIVRHLSILTPLNNLIVDGAVPRINNVVSFDPDPPFNGINRYERPSEDGVNYFELFTSILPDHELQDASMDHGRDSPEMPRSPLRLGQNPIQNRGFSDDSDLDTDSDDGSDPSQGHDDVFHGVTYRGTPGTTDAIRLFMGLYDTMFIRLPIQNIRQRHPLLNEDLYLSDDDITDRTSDMAEGPLRFAAPRATSDTDMDDSDDESDPVIATLPIRNGAQFYRDLCQTFASRESIESTEPIQLSPMIDLERVRRGDFSDDHSYSDEDYCMSCAARNETNVNDIALRPEGTSYGADIQESSSGYRPVNNPIDITPNGGQGNSEGRMHSNAGQNVSGTSKEEPPQYQDINGRYVNHNGVGGDSDDDMGENEEGFSGSGSDDGDDDDDDGDDDITEDDDEADVDDEEDEEDEEDEDDEDDDDNDDPSNNVDDAKPPQMFNAYKN